EPVVDDDHAIDGALGVELGEPVRDRLRVGVRRPVAEAAPRVVDLVAAEAERRGALAADDGEADLHALVAEPPLERERAAQDLRVEGAREAAIARDRNDRRRLDLAALEERKPAQRRARPRR